MAQVTAPFLDSTWIKQRMIRVFIEAMEYALPSTVVTNEDLARENPTWDMSRLAERSGVEARHIAGPNETALDLGYRACRSLHDQGLLDGIDGLIFCTETPDYPLPPNACILHQRLELPTHIMAFDITLACSGFVYALGIARSLVISRAARRVLVVTADTYSRLIHHADRSSRCLFGDGAAATTVGSQSKGIEVLDVSYGTAGNQHDRFIVKAGGARKPHSKETQREVTDRNGNIRTAEHIEMDGLRVLSFFNQAIPQAVRDILRRNNVSDYSVSCFIFHQASRVVLDGISRALNIPPERVVFDMTRTGNLVSASIPVALRRAKDAGRLVPGTHVILCGFGVGLSWATALVKP
jgi:3-oxoacyl-[acyl-carrier-protein] synthase III